MKTIITTLSLVGMLAIGSANAAAQVDKVSNINVDNLIKSVIQPANSCHDGVDEQCWEDCIADPSPWAKIGCLPACPTC